MEKIGKKSDKKVCFFVTPIGAKDSQERSRSNNVMQYIIEPAIGYRYKIVRADKISQLGSITKQVFDYLKNADLVIADLFGFNPNVFYELGIRHALNKPCILLSDPEIKIPFDISHERAVMFTISDLASVSDAKDDLRKLVDAINQESFRYQSPFFSATQFLPEDFETPLSEISETLDEMKVELESISNYGINIELPNNYVDIDWEIKQIRYEVEDMRKDVKRLLDK